MKKFQSHGRFTLGLKAYDSKIQLTPLITVEFQPSVLIQFHTFGHWTL